jgi:hypothetical protein
VSKNGASPTKPERVVGEAGVRTVAHGFEPWVDSRYVIWEPASAGERKLSIARQGGLTNQDNFLIPRLKAWATVLTSASPTLETPICAKRKRASLAARPFVNSLMET